MNIFGFRPFKGKFNLGNADDIPNNQDGTLIGSIKQINSNLTASDNLKFKFSKSGGKYGYLDSNGNFVPFKNPAGTLSITSNGTYDVTDYASANVNVSSCLVVVSAPMDGYSDHACWITRDEYKGYAGVALIGGTSGSFYANGSMAGIGSTPFWFDYNSATGYIGLTFSTNQYGGIYFQNTQPRLSFVLYK